MFFYDRRDAGQKLADKLAKYRHRPNTLVIGLPRGGVVVAQQIASRLHLPLDIIVPRKIGAPNNPEFALGAIAGDKSVWDKDIILQEGITQKYLKEETAKEEQEAQRRLKLYRPNRPALDVKNKTIIVADDGIATGATMQVTIDFLKNKGAGNIVIAVPVLPKTAVEKFARLGDRIIYLDAPRLFMAVGNFYDDFRQITDEEVIKIMSENLS